MKVREWGAFVLLGLIWGSSFLWIKVAVAEIGPFMLVALRVLFGLIGLAVIMLLRRKRILLDGRALLGFFFLGVFNTALPFTLISWGETHIESALASILNGTMPLFTIVIAHLWLKDEKINLQRSAGLVTGFFGVLILVTRDFDPDKVIQADLLGQLAVLAAAACYATAATFTRRHMRGHAPLVQSLMTLLFADALLWVALPIAERPIQFPALPITWLALAWLGLLGSCVAYLLYFFLINTWGPTRASLVTYIFPVVGVILGVTFLNEVADWRLILGTALVVGGIVLVNLRARRRPAVQSVALD
ncbi:MAG TPA: DMT family transporter [Anaerolineales bacterium]|nr:DMT family transporter [Anaerolineales bacterium]